MGNLLSGKNRRRGITVLTLVLLIIAIVVAIILLMRYSSAA